MQASIELVRLTEHGREDILYRTVPARFATVGMARHTLFKHQSRPDAVKIWVNGEEVASYSKWDYLREYHGIHVITYGNRRYADEALAEIGRKVL
jgi:hypothetical protein